MPLVWIWKSTRLAASALSLLDMQRVARSGNQNAAYSYAYRTSSFLPNSPMLFSFSVSFLCGEMVITIKSSSFKSLIDVIWLNREGGRVLLLSLFSSYRKNWFAARCEYLHLIKKNSQRENKRCEFFLIRRKSSQRAANQFLRWLEKRL